MNKPTIKTKEILEYLSKFWEIEVDFNNRYEILNKIFKLTEFYQKKIL